MPQDEETGLSLQHATKPVFDAFRNRRRKGFRRAFAAADPVDC